MALPILAKTITSALVKKGTKAKKESKKVSTEKLLPGSVGNKVKVSKFKSRTPRPYRKKFEPTKFLPPSKIDENFDMEKLDDLLASLVDNTKDLEKITKKDLSDEKKKNTQKKNAKEKLKRNKREEETEEKKAVVKVKSSPMKFKAPDFFKDILAMGGRLVLATGVMTLLNFLTDPEKKDGLFKFLENNLDKILIGGIVLTAGAILAPLLPVFGAVIGLGKILLAPLLLALRFTGKIARKALNILKRGRDLLRRPQPEQPRVGSGTGSGTISGDRSTRGFRDPGRYRPQGQAAAGGFQLEQSRRGAPGPTVRGPNPLRQLYAQLETGTLFKKGSGFQKALFKGLKTKFGLKAIGRVISPLVKRIPILGALIDFALNYFLFKEPVGRAAFAAIGSSIFAALGATAGSIIPFGGTLVGGVLGGLAGDVAGKWLYDTFFSGKEPIPQPEETPLLPSVESEVSSTTDNSARVTPDTVDPETETGEGSVEITGDGSGGSGTLTFKKGGKVVGSQYKAYSGVRRTWGSSQEDRRNISGDNYPMPDGTYPLIGFKEHGPWPGLPGIGDWSTFINPGGTIGSRSGIMLHNDIGSDGTAGCIGVELGGTAETSSEKNFLGLYKKVNPKKIKVSLASAGESSAVINRPKNSDTQISSINRRASYEQPAVEVAFVKVPTPVPMSTGGSSGGGSFTGGSGGNVNSRYEDLVLTTHYREA